MTRYLLSAFAVMVTHPFYGLFAAISMNTVEKT